METDWKRSEIEAIDIAVTCARVAEDKKGTEIRVLEVGSYLPITDFFVFITCTNRRHLLALSEELLKFLKETWPEGIRAEGVEAGWWVLLDAGPVVIHLFEERARRYYDLDQLWADAGEVDWRKGPLGQTKPA